MKKKILCLAIMIALMCVPFFNESVLAIVQPPESASIVVVPTSGNIEFYNSNNEKITNLQMNQGSTVTVTAKFKFNYESANAGEVSKIPVSYSVRSSSADLELIPAENGWLGDEGAISGYNTDCDVIYDGVEHKDCYVSQTFQIKANAIVNSATIVFIADINLEDTEYSYKYNSLTVSSVEAKELVDYNVDGSEEVAISFKNESGKEYIFESVDITGINDEYIQQIVDLNGGTVSFERLKAAISGIVDEAKDAVSGNGEFLKVFSFRLYDGDNEIHEAPNGFKIKIKITDDIKGYDTYKLYFIRADGTTEDAIILKKNGEYLEGILPHLSRYALVGENVEETNSDETTSTDTSTKAKDETPAEESTTAGSTTVSNSPKTGDNIVMWISLVTVSMVGIVGITRYTHRKK